MQKKIPMRQCVGCREMKPKKELVRVVRAPDGTLSLDFRGKAPGRGAYVCPDPECLKRARKARALERAFDCAVAPEIYDVAKDAADHTFRRARSFCRSGKPPYICAPYTKEELGGALGCNACALCALTDAPLALAFMQALGDTEKYAPVMEELQRQTDRVKKRRQEEKAHRNNIKHGK